MSLVEMWNKDSLAYFKQGQNVHVYDFHLGTPVNENARKSHCIREDKNDCRNYRNLSSGPAGRVASFIPAVVGVTSSVRLAKLNRRTKTSQPSYIGIVTLGSLHCVPGLICSHSLQVVK